MKKQKLINFKKNEDFQKDLKAGELLETSIIFVDDTKKIYTHGTEFDCSGGGSSVNADWEAKEGEEGFIKNKPFGETEELVLFAYTPYANATSKTGNGYGGYQMSFYNQGHSDENYHNYDTSKKYKVVINGVVYDNLIPNFNGYLSDDYTGGTGPLYEKSNFILMTSNGAAAGIMHFKEPLPSNSTIEIYQYNASTKQLDSKFLPIVQQTGDSETSIMSQKAVTDAISNFKVGYDSWNGSLEDYEALDSYDDNTIYYIEEEQI